MPEVRLTLIAALIDRDECTHAEIVARFERCARDNGEDATLSVRTLRRWVAGDVRTVPRPSQRRVARLLWGFSMSELLSEAPDTITSGSAIEQLANGGTAAPAAAFIPAESSTDSQDGS